MLNVVPFPGQSCANVSAQLRNLADEIDRGDYGDAHSVTWVVDCGDARIEVGFSGQSPLPAGAAHLSLAMGMRKLELLQMP